MTKTDWLAKARENKDVLRSLILNYHPANLQPHGWNEEMDSSITAPNAEKACEVVRNLIRKESLDCPEIQFDIALSRDDYEVIANLLSQAWMGVPESTSCWYITGFREAVDLLDDPVENENC